MSKTQILLSSIFFASSLNAQAPRHPREPMLANMPDRAEWVLEFGSPDHLSGSGAEAPESPSVGTFSISKNGKIYKIVSDKPIGGYQEAWVIDSRVFLVSTDLSRCVVVGTAAFPATDFSAGDFEYFEWIQAANFVGVEELDDQEVFVFETDSLNRSLSPRDRAAVQEAIQTLRGQEVNSDGTTDEIERSESPISNQDILGELGWGEKIRAYLDAKTQRPILLESDKLRIAVKALPASVTLIPPPSVERRLRAIQDEAQRLKRRPSAPK